MALYTFIMNYGGGIYTSQVRARSVKAAARKWAETFDPKPVTGFGNTGKRQLIERIDEDDPTALTGVIRVWYMSALVRNQLASINIIETAE